MKALHLMYKRWFFNDCRAYNKTSLDPTTNSHDTSTSILAIEPSDIIVASSKEKEQRVELGFVEKLIELWRLRRGIVEAKAEILV